VAYKIDTFKERVINIMECGVLNLDFNISFSLFGQFGIQTSYMRDEINDVKEQKYPRLV
jgi:hypothetical protein